MNASLATKNGSSVWTWLCALATALKLWLVSAQTVYAIAPSPADDGLFLAHADSILRGEWLGELTDLTLVKGPVYPLWLALNHLSGAPLLLSQAVLYALACAVLALAVRPLVPARSWRALLYVAVLMNPSTWANGPATRVTREGIYSSLAILVLGFAIGTVLRLRDASRRSALWATGAGLTGALFVMTREEGLWLGPSLLIIGLAGAVAARHSGWRSVAIPAAAALAAYAVPTTAVAMMNWKHYGVFETCETSSEYFRSAYGALTRVKTSRWHPHVPVSREARFRAYEASPAFREIGRRLEESAANWTRHGCQNVNVCDDIAGGWFMWTLRMAATNAGKYRSGAVAQAWYEQVTREIDGACRDGRLDCLPARSTLRPPWRAEYLRPLLSAVGRAAVFVSTFEAITPYPSAPAANGPDIAWIEDLTNEQLPRPVVRMRGLVASRAGEFSAAVVDPSLRGTAASFQRAPVPPSERPAGAGVSFTRLTLETSCVVDCHLVLLDGENRAQVVPIQAGTRSSGDGSLVWTPEAIQLGAALDGNERYRTPRLATLAAVTRAYAAAVPALLAAAMAALLWRLARAVRARTIPDPLTLVSVALLAAVSVRLLLLGLIEVSSFRGIEVVYCSPAYGLLLAFVMLEGARLGAALPSCSTRRRLPR